MDIITSSVSESTFIERERFDDPDKFIEYMQSEYDAWYDEGYGNLPPSEVPTHEPNKNGQKSTVKNITTIPFYMSQSTFFSTRTENGKS